MKNTLLTSLVIASALASHSSAATITFDFTAVVPTIGTSYDGGLISGTVSYDDTIIDTNNPTEFYAPNASITVAAFDQTFDEGDDLETGMFPILTLSPAPGSEWAFTFIVAESGGTNPVAINAPEISGFEINLDPIASGQPSYVASISVTPSGVPEVGSSLLLLLGTVSFGLRRRR